MSLRQSLAVTEIAALLIMLILALSLRLYGLVPPERGLRYAQDADEGAYLTSAQLMLQGYLPYRDFFAVIPPAAIYFFAAVLRLTYAPWGSPSGFMAARYLCVAVGTASVLVTYLIGRKVGGRWAGLLAAIIVAVDGIVVAQDRRAMLEAPSNLFTLLAILAYLRAMESNSPLPLVGAGVCSTLALLSKGTALIVPLLIVLHILLRRRFRALLIFTVTVAATYLPLAGYFLITCPEQFLKQVYLFHLLRPADGTIGIVARLAEIWNYTWSWLTVRLGLLGFAFVLLTLWQDRKREQELVVLGWGVAVLLLNLSARTYWATYFSQLAFPFAIWAGQLLSSQLANRTVAKIRLLYLQVGFIALVCAFSAGNLVRQAQTTRDALCQSKPVHLEMAALLRDQVPVDASVLVFEPNYTFLASRPLAGLRDSGFFVDSYGEMLYTNLGMATAPLLAPLERTRGDDETNAMAVFHRQQAQDLVLALFRSADYVVLDARAARQLSSDTQAYILAHSQLVASASGATLRIRLSE